MVAEGQECKDEVQWGVDDFDQVGIGRWRYTLTKYLVHQSKNLIYRFHGWCSGADTFCVPRNVALENVSRVK